MSLDQNVVLAIIRASRPSFRNKHDKIAFALHASFVASGYLLTAVGPAALHDSSSSSSDEIAVDGWNSMDEDYAFVYHNPKDSKKLLVRCLAMNDKLLIDVFMNGNSQPVHAEINVDDFASDASGSANYANHYNNFSSLIKSLETGLFAELDGKPAAARSNKASSSMTEGSANTPQGAPQPYGGHPDTDDTRYSGSGFVYPSVPVNPGGYSDLIPGPPAGVFPRHDFEGDGSSLVGPNDPRWFGGPGRRGPGFPGVPQPGVPPGARYDPFGPPDVPGFEPNRFTRDPRRPGRGRGHPDLEHFPGGSDFI